MSVPDERVGVLLAGLRLGLTITGAATKAGIPISTLNDWRRADQQFNDLVCQTLRRSGTPEAEPIGMGRGSGPPPVLIPAARDKICEILRAGGALAEAAKALRISPTTIKRTRHADPEFDQQVVDAGQAAGRRFTRLSRPPCPGSACATQYGYDVLGCHELACREAAIARRRR